MDVQELRSRFIIDCENCCGLCCVALFCMKSDGFPKDKPAGEPCCNLTNDFKCKIHSDLKQNEMKGCLSFDCMGAGQYVTNDIYQGNIWQKIKKDAATSMFSQFLTIMNIRQSCWYLLEAYERTRNSNRKIEIEALIEEYYQKFDDHHENFYPTEVDEWRDKANVILKNVSIEILNFENKKFEKRKDFIGQDMSNENVKGMDFTMSYLMAAGFRCSNLYHVNFLGADIRDTDVRGADLSDSLFLTQMQVNSCIGDHTTNLPNHLKRPAHWDF